MTIAKTPRTFTHTCPRSSWACSHSVHSHSGCQCVCWYAWRSRSQLFPCPHRDRAWPDTIIRSVLFEHLLILTKSFLKAKLFHVITRSIAKINNTPRSRRCAQSKRMSTECGLAELLRYTTKEYLIAVASSDNDQDDWPGSGWVDCQYTVARCSARNPAPFAWQSCQGESRP